MVRRRMAEQWSAETPLEWQPRPQPFGPARPLNAEGSVIADPRYPGRPPSDAIQQFAPRFLEGWKFGQRALLVSKRCRKRLHAPPQRIFRAPNACRGLHMTSLGPS